MSPRETDGKPNDFALTGLARRIVIPPLVAFLLLSVYVVAEALGYRGVTRPDGETAAEAAALGRAARTVELIAKGQNPNQLLHVRAAVLARHAELVRLLLRSGAARFDTSRAVCFARVRLPEVLPDLGASAADSREPIDVATAFSMCGTD
jgi:hypothetical protein